MATDAIGERPAAGLSRLESSAWGGTLALGALWSIGGVLCMATSGLGTVATVYYAGLLLALAGLIGIVYGVRGAGGRVVLLGALPLVVGVLLFTRPDGGMAGLTLLLIGYFWVSGLYGVVTSIAERYEAWGMDFASGVCSLAIGAIAANGRPSSAFWLVGMLVGAELLARGLFMMAAALTRGARPRARPADPGC